MSKLWRPNSGGSTPLWRKLAREREIDDELADELWEEAGGLADGDSDAHLSRYLWLLEDCASDDVPTPSTPGRRTRVSTLAGKPRRAQAFTGIAPGRMSRTTRQGAEREYADSAQVSFSELAHHIASGLRGALPAAGATDTATETATRPGLTLHLGRELATAAAALHTAFTAGNQLSDAARESRLLTPHGRSRLASEIAQLLHREGGANTNAPTVIEPARLGELWTSIAHSFRRTAAARALLTARQHGVRTELPYRNEMEDRFDRTFSGLEVLTGSGAETAAASIDAGAFAVGNTVVLPSSPSRSLVAHELAHVVQQGGDRGHRVDDSTLTMTSPGDSAEHEAHHVADLVASGAHAPNINAHGQHAARLARSPTTSTTTTDAPVAAPAGSVADRVKLILPPSSFPLLHQHVIDAIEADPQLETHLDAEDKKQLIAIGRAQWRKTASSVGKYIEELVAEIGGQGRADADKKIAEIKAEQYFEEGLDPQAVKDRFWNLAADLLGKDEWIYRKDVLSVFQQVIKDHLDDTSRFVRRGRLLQIPGDSPFLYRTTTLGGYYQWNMSVKARTDLVADARSLFDDEHQNLVVEKPDAPAGQLSALDYWAYRCATRPEVAAAAHTTLDRETKYGGANQTTWWSYAGMMLRQWGPHPADQARGFSYLIRAAGLEPEWYATGAMYITIDSTQLKERMAAGDVGQLRKPTAFDGLLSPLYEPNINENDWGITAGRLPEAVAPHIPADLTVPGAQGLRPFVQDATARFDRIAQAVSAGPSPQGKKEFANSNRPFPVIIHSPNVSFTIPGDAEDKVTVSNPVSTTPGVKVKSAQVVLDKGGDAGKASIKSGKLEVDINAGGAIKKPDAKLDIAPSTTPGVDGTAKSTEIENVDSPLEGVLGRIKPTARITDTGIEASAEVKPGPSGIPGFDLERGNIKLTYTDQLAAEGTVAIVHRSKTTGLKGELGAVWDGSELGVKGELTANEGLIEGLGPLRLGFHRLGERTTISTESVAFKRTIGDIEVTGQARDLDFDVTKGALSGQLDLGADLGMLGRANAAATIADNKLGEVVFKLEHSQFSYPKDKPLVVGVVDGDVKLNKGKMSGSLHGDASLTLPGALGGGAEQVVGLETKVRVGADGSYEGGVSTKGPVDFGKYLTINKASLALTKGGGVDGTISATLKGDIPFLEKGASITWQVTNGVPKVTKLNAKLSGTLERFSEKLKLELAVTEQGLTGSIVMADGASPIKGVNIGANSRIDFSFNNGQIVAGGTVRLAHEKGYFTDGVLNVTWKDGWSITGSAKVGNVIPGIDSCDVAIEEQASGGLRIFAKDVVFNQTLQSIKLSGKVGLLEYDTKNGTFGGDIDISKVDLGMFGTASATGKIVKNELTEATFDYQAPSLRFPTSGTPVLSADDTEAKLAYKRGKFSGSFKGTARLNVPKLGDAGDAGVKFDVRVGSDGSYRGSFEATKPIVFKEVLKIHKLKATVDSEGGLDGKFSVQVENVPFVKKGNLDFAFSKDGIRPTGAHIELSGAMKQLGAEATIEADEQGLKGEIKLTGKSGIAGFDLTTGSMTIAKPASGPLTASGSFGFKHDKFGIAGSVTIGWNGNEWTYDGHGTAEAGLVEGLGSFEVSVKKDAEGTTVGGKNAVYKRTFGGAITLEGSVPSLSYNVTTQKFSAELGLKADLGMLGHAEAEAKIVDNKVNAGQFTYKSKKLTYPPKGEPLISGDIEGTITYQNEKFSGSVTSNATLHIPKKFSADPVSAKVNVRVAADGTYSGKVAVTDKIMLGEHFRINGLEGTITADGDVESKFDIELVNAAFLGKGGGARLAGKIDKTGFTPERAEIKFAYGSEKDKAGGECTLIWDETDGIKIAAKGHYKLNDDLVATGEITYDNKNKLKATLGVGRIELLKKNGLSKNLFHVDFNMPIFSIGVAGAFIGAKFDLDFKLNWGLGVTPSVTLDGLDLETFQFKVAKANMKFDGELSAELVGTPAAMLGLFVLHPWVVSGSGGLAFPVTAKASVKPSADTEISYSPDGGISGGVSAIELPLTFDLKAAVEALLEVKALGGRFGHTWKTQLTETTLVEDTELMRHKIDFADLSTQEKPTIPEKRQAPAAPPTGEGVATTKEPGEKKAITANADKEPPEEEPPAKDDSEGFGVGQILELVKGNPDFQSIQGVIESGARAYEKIKGFFNAVIKFFTGWIGEAYDIISKALQIIAEKGFVEYLRELFREYLGDELYNIFEPMFDMMGHTEEKFMRLVDKLSKPEMSLDWLLDFGKLVLDLSWGSITEAVSAIGKVIGNVGTYGPALINRMIKEGKIGVQRHARYIWNPNPWGSNWWFLAADQYKLFGRDYEAGDVQWPTPSAAVAYTLWFALNQIDDVRPTNMDVESHTGEPYEDYWAGAGKSEYYGDVVMKAVEDTVQKFLTEADDPKALYEHYKSNGMLAEERLTLLFTQVCVQRGLDPATGRAVASA